MTGPVSLTVGSLLAGAEVRLRALGIDTARLDAEVLMAHVMGVDRGRLAAMLAAKEGARVEDRAAAAFEALIARRALREPVAYITGRREFWSLDFEVTPAVLIPRPETELLVEEALAMLARTAPAGATGRKSPRVADIGTGSGAVAVALATERPDAFVVATDISMAALEVARRNTRHCGVGSRVALLQADLLEGVAGLFDVVVSNPPYVGRQERATLMPEVRDHEPAQALFAGAQGLDLITRLIAQTADRLVPGGWLLLEISPARAADCAAMIGRSGLWQDFSVRDDYAGLPRVVKAARRPDDLR